MRSSAYVESFSQIPLASRFGGAVTQPDSFDLGLYEGGLASVTAAPFLELRLSVPHGAVVAAGDTFNLVDHNNRTFLPGTFTFLAPRPISDSVQLNGVTAGHVNILSVIPLLDSGQKIVGYEGSLETPNGPFTFTGVAWLAP